MAERVHRLFEWYEKRLAPLAFIAGFLFDTLTLTRIDLLIDNIILIAHLSIVAIGIILINAHEERRLHKGVFENLSWIAPFMIQFSLGALFSGLVVFYFRSGSIAGSWAFLGLLILLLIGNEFFRERYRRMAFHSSLYFLGILSYAIFAVPIFFAQIGAFVFIVSGLLSLVVFSLFFLVLRVIVPKRSRENQRRIVFSVLSIFLVINVLYFTNIIPPIPLSLKRLGIYHSVERTDMGGYKVLYEKALWYSFFQDTSDTYSLVAGEPVFAFSAIFAPTSISTKITHEWYYLDPELDRWVLKSSISFFINGGRDEGYRGFTEKFNVVEGKWRVDVRTLREQLLGRVYFTARNVSYTPNLVSGEY